MCTDVHCGHVCVCVCDCRFATWTWRVNLSTQRKTNLCARSTRTPSTCRRRSDRWIWRLTGGGGRRRNTRRQLFQMCVNRSFMQNYTLVWDFIFCALIFMFKTTLPDESASKNRNSWQNKVWMFALVHPDDSIIYSSFIFMMFSTREQLVFMWSLDMECRVCQWK